VRVAKALDFNDIRKNNIAELITSAAIKTDEIVGDGTTTTVMMVRNLYRTFVDEINFHTSRMIDKLVQESKIILNDLVTPVTPDDYRFESMVKTTSNYQDDIALQVIRLFQNYTAPNVSLKRGNGNLVDLVEENNTVVFDGKFGTPQLQYGTIRGKVVFGGENPADVLLINGDIRVLDEGIINSLIRRGIDNKGKPIVIIARSFDQQLMDMFVRINGVINKQLSTGNSPILTIIPFSINGSGSLAAESMNDLSTILNATAYAELEYAVESDPATSDVNFTLDISGLYLDPKDDVVKERIEKILSRIEPVYTGMNFTEKASYVGKFLFMRISRLKAGNVTIIVSGMTKAEISERFYLYEDAIRVASSSLQFGTLPGIGWGYNQVAEKLHQRYSHLGASNKEQEQVFWVVVKKFITVLTAQYEYLTGNQYIVGSNNKYMDLVTLEENNEPENVFDNGSASIIALEGGWSVVKRLTNLSCILGKHNTSYGM